MTMNGVMVPTVLWITATASALCTAISIRSLHTMVTMWARDKQLLTLVTPETAQVLIYMQGLSQRTITRSRSKRSFLIDRVVTWIQKHLLHWDHNAHA